MFSILTLSHCSRSGSKVHGLAILLVLGLASLTYAGPIQARGEKEHASEAVDTADMVPSGAGSGNTPATGHIVHHTSAQEASPSADAPETANHVIVYYTNGDSGEAGHYTLGQLGPYWPITMIKNPIARPLNIVFDTSGTPCPELTWLLIAMLETQRVDIAIERDESNVMKEATYNNRGNIEFELKLEGLTVAKGVFRMSTSVLRLAAWHMSGQTRSERGRNPEVLLLHYDADHVSLRIEKYERNMLGEKISGIGHH
ncbi:hypothetical protein EV360DRAFT_80653 [Lentinula raphanica]|nr:hypothetical protein EV360DRAFT_80653 [Lentinula raphanica]